MPATSTALAKYACNNKKITSNLLHNAGITVPKGFRVKPDYTEKYLTEVFLALKKPVVVKPSNGNLGDNITVGITDFEQYQQALNLAFSYTDRENAAIVEEMFSGKEYRILVTREKVLGILHRVPANVVGDGKQTIKSMIKQKNTQAIRSEDGTKSHLKIRIDADLRANLKNQELELSTVLKAGKQVFLRKVSNISKGGDAIDFTDEAHPSVNQIALDAIQAVPGLSFAGVDFLTQDITKQQTPDSYVIIEINDSPGFDIHDYPYKGKNRHVAREFLYLLFPELRTS